MSFTPGTRVRFAYGPQQVEGTVVEDRGGIGVLGRQILLVEVCDLAVRFEMPADEVERLGPPRRKSRGQRRAERRARPGGR